MPGKLAKSLTAIHETGRKIAATLALDRTLRLVYVTKSEVNNV